MPVSLRGEALGRMVWSWYHFLILKIDMVMSTGMSRLNCVGEESLASSSQENRLEFQHLKWIVIICRKNNPGARKAVYQIGLITPKVKCFCPVILNFVCSSIFLIEDVYSKGRRNFLRLVLQDPSWCSVVVVDCKDVFSHPHCVPHPFFGVSPSSKKRWTPCRAVLLDQWLRRSRGNGWWRTQLKGYPTISRMWVAKRKFANHLLIICFHFHPLGSRWICWELGCLDRDIRNVRHC